jgi:hypothetical protein
MSANAESVSSPAELLARRAKLLLESLPLAAPFLERRPDLKATRIAQSRCLPVCARLASLDKLAARTCEAERFEIRRLLATEMRLRDALTERAEHPRLISAFLQRQNCRCRRHRFKSHRYFSALTHPGWVASRATVDCRTSPMI